jgi:uncharacterized protein YktB (UPF0637 family)
LSFDGFTQKEFKIFDVPGYQARMPLLRSEITSRFKEFGPSIGAEIEKATGLELHPHIALHMRRTVNAPEETWVAFCRNTRSYKPFVHFRVAINREGMHVKVFVEDDADDKPIFAGGLKRNASAMVSYFAQNPAVRSYDLPNLSGEPRSGSTLKKVEIERFADRLKTVKGQHASFGILLGKEESVVGAGEALTKAVVEAAQTMLPIYKMGMEKTFKL